MKGGGAAQLAGADDRKEDVLAETDGKVSVSISPASRRKIVVLAGSLFVYDNWAEFRLAPRP